MACLSSVSDLSNWGGLTAQTQMRASGTQLRPFERRGYCQLDSEGSDIHMQLTKLKHRGFVLCKPLNTCVPKAWMMKSNTNCIQILNFLIYLQYVINCLKTKHLKMLLYDAAF